MWTLSTQPRCTQFQTLTQSGVQARPTWDQLEISARHSESLDLACAGAQLVSGTTEEYIGSWLDKNPELRSKAPTETIWDLARWLGLGWGLAGAWPNFTYPLVIKQGNGNSHHLLNVFPCFSDLDDCHDWLPEGKFNTGVFIIPKKNARWCLPPKLCVPQRHVLRHASPMRDYPLAIKHGWKIEKSSI